jgi:hypothetical protein
LKKFPEYTELDEDTNLQALAGIKIVVFEGFVSPPRRMKE